MALLIATEAFPLDVASLRTHTEAVPTPNRNRSDDSASRLITWRAPGNRVCKRLRGTCLARSEELESPTF
jgi:hypothetical protein